MEGRRWLNSGVCSLLSVDENTGAIDPGTIVPFLDGGTEGFKGHLRLILPSKTACLECNLDAFPPQKTIPMCTVIDRPCTPQHCIREMCHISILAVLPSALLHMLQSTPMLSCGNGRNRLILTTTSIFNG